MKFHKLKLLGISLITLFVILETAFLLFPKFVDLNKHKDKICNLLEANLKEKVSFDSISYKTYPDFSIYLKVTNPKIGEIYKADNFETSIGLGRIIFKKISFKNFSTQNTKLNIIRFKDDTTNLDYILSQPMPVDVLLNKTNISVDNYEAIFTDNFVNRITKVSGEKLGAQIDKKTLNIQIKSKIICNNESSNIDLDIKMPRPRPKGAFENREKNFVVTGYIKNLKPKFFDEYIKLYLNKDITNITGVINADFKPEYENKKLKSVDAKIDIDNFALNNKNKVESIIFDKHTKIRSKILYSNKNIKIQNFDLTGEGFKISASGEIKNYKSKHAKEDITLTIDNSKSDSLYWMFPSSFFTPNTEVRKLKGYGFYANTNAKINIKGLVDKPELYGYINFEDTWIINGFSKDVPKATILTDLDKTKIKVDAKIWGAPKEFVSVVGESDIYNKKYNHYLVTSTPRVPLVSVKAVLPAIADTVDFNVGPVPYMNVNGYGNINLETIGSPKNPDLNGQFNFINSCASFYGLNAELCDGTGSVDFKKDKVYFTTQKATMFGKEASLKGVSDLNSNMEYDAYINKAPLDKLINVLKTSPILEKDSKQVSMIKSSTGTADFTLNLKGKMPEVFDTSIMMDTIIPSGQIKLYDAGITTNNSISLSNINGIIEYGLDYLKMNLKTNLYSSPLDVFGEIKKQKADFTISSNQMHLADTIKLIIDTGCLPGITQTKQTLSTVTKYNLKISYKGAIDKFEFKNITADAVFPKTAASKSLIDVLNGSIHLKQGDLIADNISLKLFNTTAHIDGNIKNYMQKPVANLSAGIKKIDLSLLNNPKLISALPIKYQKILNAYKDYSGVATADIKIKNNDITGKIWLRNISIIHSVLEYPFSIKASDLDLKDKKINIKNFNATFAGTPIFLYGDISDFRKNPKFNITFSSKLSGNFIHNYINTYLTYPINVKGEILFSSQIKGTKSAMVITPSIKLEEGADISYMGANFGDEKSIREVTGEIKTSSNKIEFKDIDMQKYVLSQNNRLYPLPVMTINATIKNLKKDKPYIEQATIKTHSPISANLFNIPFKKSLIKNGNISGDLSIKGFIDNLDINGFISMKNIEVPLYETIIKDTYAKFNNKKIDLISKIDYMDSNISINSVLDIPSQSGIHIHDINIDAQKIDMDKTLDYLDDISYSRPLQIIDKQSITPVQINSKAISIDKGHINIDDVQMRTLHATDVKSNISLKNNTFHSDNIILNVASGQIKGKFQYNVDSAKTYADLEAINVDSNLMASSLLNINNQIYGILNGKIAIMTFGATGDERIGNLTGNLNFNINDGKMPKLGSLEYLLRAGNIIKSGVSGLTLNGVTGLLVPIQTGSFDTINGHIILEKGVAKNIKIYTRGENLSLLLIGQYNLVTQKPNIYVLGKLSKKIDTILGPLGNTSLNTFFNLIPGISLDEQKDSEFIQLLNSIPELSVKSTKYRYFKAVVDGDLDTDKFVSVFEWIDK